MIYETVKGLVIIAELLARAKRARGRSPIANVIYPKSEIRSRMASFSFFTLLDAY